MQCIVVKSDEFEKSLPQYIFPLNPDYVAARSLRSLRSNNVCIYAKDLKRQSLILLCSWRCFPNTMHSLCIDYFKITQCGMCCSSVYKVMGLSYR